MAMEHTRSRPRRTTTPPACRLSGPDVCGARSRSFPCEYSRIAGTLWDYQSSVDFLAGQTAPRVSSHGRADPQGSSTWRGGDDEYREVGGLVSGPGGAVAVRGHD